MIEILSDCGHTQRELGFEVRVDFVDEKGSMYNESITFPTEPTDDELMNRIV